MSRPRVYDQAVQHALVTLQWLRDMKLEVENSETKQGLLSNRCAIRLRRGDRAAITDCEDARDLHLTATDVHAYIVLFRLANNDLLGAAVALKAAQACAPCLALLRLLDPRNTMPGGALPSSTSAPWPMKRTARWPQMPMTTCRL